jgi:large subunit ribosomal protein L4
MEVAMPTVDVFNMQNQVVSQVELDDRVFDVQVAEHLVHQVVRMQLANRRAGTACVKNRALVSGSRKKPWRQKGTGRARAGTRQSPLWRGGGVVFGPTPRDFGFKLNRKVKKAALGSVLTQKLREGKLKVLDHMALPQIRTRHMEEALRGLGLSSSLIVIPERNETVEKSARNIRSVQVTLVDGLNVYDVLRYRDLVIIKDCLPRIEQRVVSS